MTMEAVAGSETTPAFNRLPAYVLGSVSIIVLTLMIASTRHLRFVFDDFEFAAGAHRMGVFEQTKDAFFRFSGRTVLLVGGGAAASLGPALAAILMGIIICVFVVTSTVVWHQLMRQSGAHDSVTAMATALCVIALGLYSLPAREQVLYWLIGGIVYVAPLSLVMTGFCWVTSIRRGSVPTHTAPNLFFRIANRLCGVGAFISIALGSGGNETIAIATLGALIAIAHQTRHAHHSHYGSKQLYRRALLMIPASVLGAAVIYGAPGQRARAHLSPTIRTMDGAIHVASEFAIALGNLLLRNFFVLLAVATIGAVFMGCSHAARIDFRRLTNTIATITGCTWFALFTVASLGSLSVPPGRALTTPWMLTVLTATVGGAALQQKFAGRIADASGFLSVNSAKPLRLFPRVLSVAIGLGIFMYVPALMKEDQRYAATAKRLDCVERVLVKAVGTPNSKTMTVFVNAPETVHDVWFAKRDPQQWPNQRIAEYYQLGGVSNDPSRATPC